MHLQLEIINVDFKYKLLVTVGVFECVFTKVITKIYLEPVYFL